MDFEIELHADARAKGGFKVWVLSGEVDGSMGRRRTQRISLTLKPKNAATRATNTKLRP
ncbi:trypco2 family protein [Streptomyces cyaneofuscatus]|uniref:trypco2 family protein n=1 Tax=Streptomyces cyaneofuscatus TaxID=66883 RepID=UPI0036568139